MKQKILFFILAFLATIRVVNAVDTDKLPKPEMSWGWASDGSDKKVMLKLNPVQTSVSDANLYLQHVAYDGALNPITGDVTTRKANVFVNGMSWDYDGDPANSMPLYRYRLVEEGGRYEVIVSESAESLAVFNGDKLSLDGGITVDGEPLTEGQTVSVGQTIRFKKEIVLAKNGPFDSELKIGTLTAASYDYTLENVNDDGEYISFTIPAYAAGKDMQFNIIARLESGMEKYFETSKLITLKVNKIKLPTPVVSWGWTTDGSDKSVRLQVSLPDGVSLPSGLISDKVKVQELNYTSDMELNTPVTSLKALSEFEEGFDWVMDVDPFTEHALYDIRLSADGYDPSDPVLVSFENKKIKLPTPEVWQDGVLVEDNGTSTVEHDVYLGSKVAVRKRAGILSGYKNDIIDIPARQVATSHVYYREWHRGQNPDNEDIDIPQTEEGDLSYFIVDKSLVDKEIYHRHIYSPNEEYNDIFETSERTPYHTMVIKSKGKLSVPTGTYAPNPSNDMELELKLFAPQDYAENIDDLTIHYMLYKRSTDVTGTTTYYDAEKKSVKGQSQLVEGILTYSSYPLFVAAYVSAPGYEDSDIIYLKEANELYLDVPRLYINGSVVKLNSNVVDVVVPDGAEVSIVNPNVYKCNAEEGAAPFVTNFGLSSYTGFPEGYNYEGDANGNGSFIADKSKAQNFTLKLFFALDSNDPFWSVCNGCEGVTYNLTVGGKLDAPTCSFKWNDLSAVYNVSINAPTTYGGNLDDLTIHYAEYFGAGVNEEKSSQLKTATARYSARYAAEAEEKPDFYAAYVSAPGFEDSDVVYFNAEGEDLKTESPRVYVDGELVAHAELSVTDLTIPFGAEIRIENPNVFIPVTARTRAAEGETAPFETCFGQHLYSGLPSGVTPDDNGNVTFTADEAGQSIPLELSLLPQSGPFKGWHQTVCRMTVDDTPTGVENIDSESNVHEEIYTMDGIRVTGKKLQKGVYIVVRNGKATKKVVND